MDAQWIKIMVNIFDNRKIRMIDALPEGETLINMWFRLLVLAGNVNDNGFIYVSKEIPYTPETLAAYWNKPLATVKMALSTFERLGMIEIVDNFLHLSNWERYQNTEALERIREKGRQRTARFREKQKLLAEPIDSNVTVTSQVTLRNGADIDIDKDIDKEYIEREEKPKRKRFEPPTLDMLNEYAREKGYQGFDAERFFNYYESNGWKVGKNPMKSWKAAVSNWVSRDQVTQPQRTPAPKPTTPNNNKFHNFEQRADDLDALLKNGRVFRGANV